MEALWKAAALGAAASALAVLIKKDNPAAALLLGVGAACVILVPALGLLRSVTGFFDRLTDASGMPPAALAAVLKTVGIAILTRFAADISRESGLAALASATELAGSAAALFVALPLMQTVFQMIEELL